MLRKKYFNISALKINNRFNLFIEKFKIIYLSYLFELIFKRLFFTLIGICIFRGRKLDKIRIGKAASRTSFFHRWKKSMRLPRENR